MTTYDASYTFGSYENELRQLIHLFKYGRVQPLARPLARFMITALPRERSFDAVVAMPLHWRKRWQRGFNQSELLAREVSRRWHVPLMPLVRRVKPTGVQAGLSAADRRANVAKAFRAKPAVAGKRILLIDDVMTTGATAGACAAALKRAGAVHVTLLTLARVDRRLSAVAIRDRDSVHESNLLRSFEDAQFGSTA